MTRVYLPGTLEVLERAQEDGEIAAPVAHAVTAALRHAWDAVPAGAPGGAAADEPDLVEQLEYAASLDAAAGSLVLLAADEDAPRRRVVLAADVPAGVLSECDEARRRARLDAGWTSAVALDRPVPWSNVVSILVDAPDSAPRVSAAADRLAGHDGADPAALRDAESSLDTCDLLWYDVTEADEVIARLRDQG